MGMSYVSERVDFLFSHIVDQDELIIGIKNKLNVMLSREEVHMLANYLDSDRSGQIDYLEFTAKINFKDY